MIDSRYVVLHAAETEGRWLTSMILLFIPARAALDKRSLIKAGHPLQMRPQHPHQLLEWLEGDERGSTSASSFANAPRAHFGC